MANANLIRYMNALGVVLTSAEIEDIKKAIALDAIEDKKTEYDLAKEWWERQSDKGIICHKVYGHYHYLRMSGSDIVHLFRKREVLTPTP